MVASLFFEDGLLQWHLRSPRLDCWLGCSLSSTQRNCPSKRETDGGFLLPPSSGRIFLPLFHNSRPRKSLVTCLNASTRREDASSASNLEENTSTLELSEVILKENQWMQSVKIVVTGHAQYCALSAVGNAQHVQAADNGSSSISSAWKSRVERRDPWNLLKRRTALAWLLLTSMVVMNGMSAEAEGAEEKSLLPLNLVSYIDEKEGFTLLRPVQWRKVDKAGANVLFEDPESKANNVGVVVNLVRIASLRDFGSPDAVADKLLQAEKRKPSTNDAQLISVKERQVHGDVPLYQLEYKLDSTRGAKRILSAVTVASKKLYILNIAFADSPEKPLSPSVASTLEKILDSFDLLN